MIFIQLKELGRMTPGPPFGAPVIRFVTCRDLVSVASGNISPLLSLISLNKLFSLWNWEHAPCRLVEF